MREMSNYEKAVRIALIEANMTMAQLAKQLGISKTYLYDIVTGSRLAVVYKERINTFLGINDDGSRKNS